MAQIEDRKKASRGAVNPEKIQVNWRINKRAFNEATIASRELGFSSVPALINVMLLKVLTSEKIKKAVFGGV